MNPHDGSPEDLSHIQLHRQMAINLSTPGAYLADPGAELTRMEVPSYSQLGVQTNTNDNLENNRDSTTPAATANSTTENVGEVTTVARPVAPCQCPFGLDRLELPWSNQVNLCPIEYIKGRQAKKNFTKDNQPLSRPSHST